MSLVAEYIEGTWLRKTGFHRDSGRLSVFKAECFVIIGSEFQRLDRLEMERNARSKSRA
jgi:hypothetical protein